MPERLNRRQFFTAGAAVTAAASWSPAALAAAAAGPAGSDPAGPTPVAPGFVRLSSNENPYGPSPLARAAFARAADLACRYPTGAAGELIARIATLEGVSADRVVLGAGSAELLSILALAYAEGGEVVCAWPTFEQLPGYAERRGATVRKLPLDAAMRHDLPALAAAVGSRTGLLYVCNPNNPTGTAIPGAELRRFCDAMSRRTLVVVDEAYLDFVEPGATESMVDLVRADRNVIVLRTFSKIHGLAGLRVGYGIAPPAVATQLRRLAPGLVPNVAGLAAARASLDDAAFLADTRTRLVADRRRIHRACDALGLRYAAAQGNFVFINVGMPVEQFRQRMHGRQLEVGRAFEPYAEWCRVTVGTSAETDAFLGALPVALRG